MKAIRSSCALVLATVATLTLGAHPAGATGGHDQQACVRSKALLDPNAQTVVAFYTTAFNFGKPELAVQRYVGVDSNGEKLYIQHNPFAADGPQAFIDFVNFFKSANPELSVRIVRVIAECDLVVTHSHITLNSDDRGNAVMDIFRLDRRGKIVEHWDVVQPVPETSANDNTMF
jgi:predicted SnoaL-like aldol condensation-catalyzing enzyme